MTDKYGRGIWVYTTKTTTNSKKNPHNSKADGGKVRAKVWGAAQVDLSGLGQHCNGTYNGSEEVNADK